MLGDLLDIERRPAGIGHRSPARAEHMHADGQAGLDRGLEDRPIAPLAEQLAGSAQEQHMRKALVAGAAADLLARRRERIHDAVLDAVEVEELLAHEVEVAARQAAVGRPGIAARRLWLALG